MIKIQQHLDKQPVGFPATASRAEIRILQHIFTPEQAGIATCLTHRPESIDIVHGRAKHLLLSPQALKIQLEAMLKKGGIEIHRTHNQVSTFDEINTLLQKARGPFVILACICRKKKGAPGSGLQWMRYLQQTLPGRCYQ